MFHMKQLEGEMKMAETNIELPNDIVLMMAIKMLQELDPDDLKAIEIDSIGDYDKETEYITIKIDTTMKE